MVGLWLALAVILIALSWRHGHGIKAVIALAFVVGLYYGQTGWAPNVTHVVASFWHGVNSAMSKL